MPEVTCCKKEENKPIPTDGWKSRKFQVTACGTAIIELAAVAGWLGLDKMTADQWVNLNQWLWPLALGIFCGSTVWEKFVYAKPKGDK